MLTRPMGNGKSKPPALLINLLFFSVFHGRLSFMSFAQPLEVALGEVGKERLATAQYKEEPLWRPHSLP